jgi:hypothetical protein
VEVRRRWSEYGWAGLGAQPEYGWDRGLGTVSWLSHKTKVEPELRGSQVMSGD